MSSVPAHAGDPILELDRIDTFYGPMQVHFQLTLQIGRGQIVCLLGGNASGKSTTMKVILGLVQPRSGSVVFDGAPITGLPTSKIIRRGLGSVPEARRLFGAMTVRENMLMGAFTRSDRAGVAADYERMMALFPRLKQPTMGLSPLHVERVLDLIRSIKQQGVTVFMVEQNAHLALQIADYGYVVQTGSIVLSGPASQLLRDPRIRDAYLGRTAKPEDQQ
jgi:branched-chain amino acid transport system ATP-binding protein